MVIMVQKFKILDYCERLINFFKVGHPMTLSLYTVKTIQVTGTVEISTDLVQRFV